MSDPMTRSTPDPLLANARIEHWQAGEDGVYVDRLRAFPKAGKDGSYRFETEWPNMPLPHVHFRVFAPGYKPLVAVWPGDECRKEAEFDLVLEPAR